MLFDKPVYLLFLALVTLLYWRLPRRGQNVLLLVASYFFYGWWDWRFVSLMAGSTLVDYFLAARIARSANEGERRAYLVTSLVMNFGFLGFFKYCNFFVDSFGHVAGFLGIGSVSLPLLRIVLPPGISFYTFQAIAYIVDVYKGRMKPAESLLDYALFISLFPHLIAGPIQRPSHLLPQVERPRELNREQFFDGIMLIVTGLFRKCVIADNCALLANAVFSGGFGKPTTPVVLLGVYAFAWQIYGDFSGYSDIARGSAQLLGFHFMVNFRQPYLSESMAEIWHRWHISLSTWLRDYLYIPLGGSRQGERRTYRNLMATMLLGGLWHGANWTYVFWGGLHGIGLAVQRWFGGRQKSRPASDSRAPSALSVWTMRVLVFHFICLGWLFFRASSISSGFQLLAGLGHIGWSASYGPAFKFLALFSLPLFLLDLRMESRAEEYPFQKTAHLPETAVALDSAIARSASVSCRRRILVAALTLVLVALFGASQPNAFIYFQF